MMSKKLLIASILLTAVFFAFPVFYDYLLAQPPGGPPPGGGSGGDDPPCFQPPCIPIDGGLGFLIAAGAALGGKKIYDASKKK